VSPKREGREWERELCTNTEATGHGKRPDPDQIRAPRSSSLHHNPHPNNLQNSSTYNTWLFNKNGQLKIKINTSKHNPHPNNLQNSSAYNTWFFNKNGQLKIKINTSEHREQISVLRIKLTKQGLSHVRSTMHTILIATGASSDACEVRSLSVPLSPMSL